MAKLSWTYLAPFVLVLCSLSVNGQNLVLQSSQDSLPIGGQMELVLRFDLPVGWAPKSPTQATWLLPNDRLPAGENQEVEIIELSDADSLLEGDRYALERKILVTSFDTGYVAINPLQIQFGKDTLESNPLLLYVSAPTVSANAVPRDIKDIRSVRYTWWDRVIRILPYALGAALVLLSLYLGIRLARRKKERAPDLEPEEKIPAHLRALAALNALESRQLWQKGEVKAYQVELNDILRNYLFDRFGIRTLERTSAEIMADLRMEGLDPEHMRKLRSVFELSDMVKFAKYPAGQAENTRAMEHVRYLIEKTSEEVVA